jgi:tetratricopeptide (TPR) repeat protein
LRCSLTAAIFGLVAAVCAAQTPPQVTLDTSETLFTIVTAINACGYNDELNVSVPLRAQIRAEVARNVRASVEAQETADVMCQYYHDHLTEDPTYNLAQYVSLALYLDAPPNFVPRVKETELPPDALNVVGFAKLAAAFYDKAGLHGVWQKNRDSYASLAERYHEPLSKLVFSTEIYLKLPSSAYLGRGFAVYMEPMGAPGQVNARNYGDEYYVVLSPGGPSLKMEQIHHTYLHYLLDPLALKYGTSMKGLEPLLDSVRNAPMDDTFKGDLPLLVTECLIRAIQIRSGSSRTLEALRNQEVQSAMEQGFVLTRYFYDALAQFEKDPEGIRTAYTGMIEGIDLRKETRRAASIHFASQASPELLQVPRQGTAQLLQTAEKRLAAGDLKAAEDLAQQALTEQPTDQGKALFIMAQVATANRDMHGAQSYFERAIQVAQEPKVIAWSHIYLGRICDLQEQREAAVDHYRAALNVAASLPEVRAAAERGLKQPYEPPAAR